MRDSCIFSHHKFRRFNSPEGYENLIKVVRQFRGYAHIEIKAGSKITVILPAKGEQISSSLTDLFQINKVIQAFDQYSLHKTFKY